MSAAVTAIKRETDAVVGVNVLRNDALAGLGVAAATGAQFVRVNVLTGVMYTDQGPIVGKAAEVARKRANSWSSRALEVLCMVAYQQSSQ